MRKEKNPLRKFSRLQLMELLAQQEKELQHLREELNKKDAELADRRIRISEAGSIAEAAIKINEVFDAAQRAADQYLENLRMQIPGESSAETPSHDSHDSDEVDQV